MSDDLEKAIQQAYGPMTSQQARTSAMGYLNQLSESAGGWRTFVEKLFATSDIQTAIVCLSLLGDLVLHRYVHLVPPFYGPFYWNYHAIIRLEGVNSELN